jgi:hypothetical protein
VLLGLRTAPKEDSGVSVAELAAEFLSTAEPAAAEFLQKLQQVELPATRPPKNQDAWNSTDSCQNTAASNSAYRCPITESKKHTGSLLLSSICYHTHDL